MAPIFGQGPKRIIMTAFKGSVLAVPPLLLILAAFSIKVDMKPGPEISQRQNGLDVRANLASGDFMPEEALSTAEDSYWPEGAKRWLQGYARSVSGETISYHSAQPDIHSALLVRAMDQNSRVEWETEAVPSDWDEPAVTFIWAAGLATHKGNHIFTLFLGRSPLLVFQSAEDSAQKLLRFKNDDGAELVFKVTKVDQFDELFGYMVLSLPNRLCPKGRPLKLSVVGEAAGSRDWYMTFQSPVIPGISAASEQALIRSGGAIRQPVRVDIVHIGPPERLKISAPASPSIETTISLGYSSLSFHCEPAETEKSMALKVEIAGQAAATPEVRLRPVRPWKIFLLPHSHGDIGYSDLQRVVEKKHWAYIEEAISLARKTADYPPEARFKWNVEILWAVESYLAAASEDERREFIDAVRQGSIGLQAFLVNPLTGIFHPEELYHLTDYARRLSRQYGLNIDSAMISDIPGSLWSIVPTLSQAGVKYYSSGPNFIPFMADGGDRIGTFLRTWGDRPFYWLSPSGREKVLLWVAGKGYSWFHGLNLGQLSRAGESPIIGYLGDLEKNNYPYDMVQVRYTIGGDNGPPDPELPDFVRSWNEKYASPRLCIATSSQMFAEFEDKYGSELPVLKGDLTPYWEDGALSTIRETVLNRHSANTLVQAETLWAMRPPEEFPGEKFYQAWRQVILFDEHTWGAHNSVSEPDHPDVVDQWAYKQAFALKGAELAQELLTQALDPGSRKGNITAVDVFNTNSWPMTGLVTIPAAWTNERIRIRDEQDKDAPSQRLSSGDLCFLAREVPPLGAKRYFFSSRGAESQSDLSVFPNRLANKLLSVTLDSATGGISQLRSLPLGVDFVEKNDTFSLGEYLYVPGRNPASALRAGPPEIRLVEKGPVVASLLVESGAPGCSQLVREITLIQDTDWVFISNSFNKEKVRDKESIHFAFPLSIPKGDLRFDIGWGVIRPEEDQLPGACKDFLYAHNWADISSPEYGLNWVTLDSPLVEPGAMTDESLGTSGTRIWKTRLSPGQKLFSYVANNYWHTNYKADQEGWVTLRYAIRPHGKFDAAEAKRFGLKLSRPLVAAPTDPSSPPPTSLFRIESPDVVVTSLRPSEDGRALMIRLYNASAENRRGELIWGAFQPAAVYPSSPFEDKKEEIALPFNLPPFGILTLRAEK
jgi:alpha-mannosidase